MPNQAKLAIDQTPLTLARWRVFVVDGNWHLVAWCVESADGRVTSPISTFDADGRLAVTQSGRLYRLAGPPGDNGDADYTWHRWKHLRGVQTAQDISQEVFRALSRSKQSPASRETPATAGAVRTNTPPKPPPSPG